MYKGSVSFAIFSVFVNAILCKITAFKIDAEVVYSLFCIKEDDDVINACLDKVVLRRKACTS